MITPPDATLERAWNRGLTTGRYKAVDDLLDHNVEAYSGMPGLYFSWAGSEKRRVHTEFLDNSVPLGQPPRTVAYGWNGELTILDIGRLIDIDRFRKVNVDATCAEEVLEAQEINAEDNMDFLLRCVEELAAVNFADGPSHVIYGRLEAGEWVWRDVNFVDCNNFCGDTIAGLRVLGFFADDGVSFDEKPSIIQNSIVVEDLNILGAWPE